MMRVDQAEALFRATRRAARDIFRIARAGEIPRVVDHILHDGRSAGRNEMQRQMDEERPPETWF